MSALRNPHCYLGLMAALAFGCSSEDTSSTGGTGGEPVPVNRPTDAEANTQRAACAYRAGALAAETLGESQPVGQDIPIDHVFILMMENRSFDHYLSQLPAYGQPDVAVADANFSNPDLNGQPVSFYHHPIEEYCVRDPNHGWNGSHDQYADGANSGFVTTNGADGARAMGYFDATDLPFYYELANTFAISDTYFSSLLGPTWPNRMYLYSGSSHGLTANTFPESSSPNVFAALNAAGVEWRSYKDNMEPAAIFIQTWIETIQRCPTCARPMNQLVSDLAAGDVPQVVFVNPEFVTGIYETSEHPPGNPHFGQYFVWELVDALTKSPIWERSALFITYDEHGGFADHVPPPPACHPGTGEPSDTSKGTFDRLGFRVPFYLVSPYAKKHYVSHVTYDHTSILRFVQARFGLPALSNRDANADAMFDLFDFENPPYLVPPTFAPPSIDPAGVTACEQSFPGGG